MRNYWTSIYRPPDATSFCFVCTILRLVKVQADFINYIYPEVRCKCRLSSVTRKEATTTVLFVCRKCSSQHIQRWRKSTCGKYKVNNCIHHFVVGRRFRMAQNGAMSRWNMLCVFGLAECQRWAIFGRIAWHRAGFGDGGELNGNFCAT